MSHNNFQITKSREALMNSNNNLKFIEKYTAEEEKPDFFLQNLDFIKDRWQFIFYT